MVLRTEQRHSVSIHCQIYARVLQGPVLHSDYGTKHGGAGFLSCDMEGQVSLLKLWHKTCRGRFPLLRVRTQKRTIKKFRCTIMSDMLWTLLLALFSSKCILTNC
jgi:hypothetical protein